MHTLNPIVFDVKSESIIIGSKLDFEIVVFLRVEQWPNLKILKNNIKSFITLF